MTNLETIADEAILHAYRDVIQQLVPKWTDDLAKIPAGLVVAIYILGQRKGLEQAIDDHLAHGGQPIDT